MYECYKLLQSEHYRNCKFNANRFTTLHTWFPFRHRVDHTESFFIQIRVYTAYNFCIYDTTVFVNNELYDNTALSTIFLCDSRIFDIFSQKDYEYTLENDTLSIDVIYGKKYRKTAHVLELKNMEVTAPHWHESVAKYKKNGGTEQLKKYDYTSYDDNTPYYTMIIKEDGRKIKLLLDLTEEMLHTIKTQHPEKVYFA